MNARAGLQGIRKPENGNRNCHISYAVNYKKTAGNSKIIAHLLLIGFIVKIISFAANLFSR